MNLPMSEIITILPQFPLNQLTTLSVSLYNKSPIGLNFSDPTNLDYQQQLLTLINSCISLKRLDIQTMLNSEMPAILAPTLARLEYFAYLGFEPPLVSHFGPNCLRVSLGGDITDQWQAINDQWLANVTHLELKNVQMHNQHIDSLIVHAVSLKVLYPYAVGLGLDWRSQIRMTPQMIGQLAKLKNLTEIDMSRIVFELPQLDRARRDLQLAQLVSLRTCNLSIDQMIHFTDFEMNTTESDLFASALSTILPNVQHLNITVDYVSYGTLQGVQSSLSLFTKLQTHSFNYF